VLESSLSADSLLVLGVGEWVTHVEEEFELLVEAQQNRSVKHTLRPELQLRTVAWHAVCRSP